MDIHAYIFVYSINNAKSFEVCKVIHDKLMDLVGQVQVPMVLVGELHRCVNAYGVGMMVAEAFP